MHPKRVALILGAVTLMGAGSTVLAQGQSNPSGTTATPQVASESQASPDAGALTLAALVLLVLLASRRGIDR